VLTTTTNIQPESTLSANSKKFSSHKSCNAKRLEKSQKLVTVSMAVFGQGSKRIPQKEFVATEILLFDFEFFIGGRCDLFRRL
jgi:hypothetical protein